MGLRKKKTVALSLDERAQIASLNGSNALVVFEDAAYALDASAQELKDLATEAHDAADNTILHAQLEADLILANAQARADQLKVAGIALDEEATGHVRRAGKIRELVGA